MHNPSHAQAVSPAPSAAETVEKPVVGQHGTLPDGRQYRVVKDTGKPGLYLLAEDGTELPLSALNPAPLPSPVACATAGPCKGYIGTIYGLIYFHNGHDVFRCPEGTAEDAITGYLHGRWECSIAHFNHYIGLYPGLSKVEVAP